jgi:photosynthetic reaction center H subunit
MTYGVVIGDIDVAQAAVYIFWGSFAGLIYYLRREDHREGYPLVGDNGQSDPIQFPPVPSPKTFVTAQGREILAPRPEHASPAPGQQALHFAGAPYLPKGDPLVDAVGPAAYATTREHHPDVSPDDGKPKLIPMRAAPAYSLSPEDTDPRGFEVIGNDKKVVGKISDIWIDRAESFIRYFEVELLPVLGGHHVLVPLDFLDIKSKRQEMLCDALSSAQFANVPQTSHAEEITIIEEDRISAYFGGGGLYGSATRAEPVL